MNYEIIQVNPLRILIKKILKIKKNKKIINLKKNNYIILFKCFIQ